MGCQFGGQMTQWGATAAISAGHTHTYTQTDTQKWGKKYEAV